MKRMLLVLVALAFGAGCGESGESQDAVAGQGEDLSVRTTRVFDCTSKDEFAPGALRITLSSLDVDVFRNDISTHDHATQDAKFKPRTNKNFVRYSNFDTDNDDDHSLSSTLLLVEKPMLAAAASGTVKHQFIDEHAGFIQSIYTCTLAK